MNRLLIVLCLLGINKAVAQNASAFAVADSLYQVGAYTQAIATYKQLPVSPAVYQRMAQAYEQLGNTPQALATYKAALKLDAENYIVSYKYGSLLRASGNYTLADSLFTNLNKKYPENPSVYYQLGYVKEQLEDSLAIGFYKRAYELDSKQQNALYCLAKLLLEQREFERARFYTDLGIAADPNSTRFILLNALNIYINKDYHEAIPLYERLLVLGKDNLQIREQLANSLALTFQYTDAIEHFKVLINQYDD